MKLDIAWLVCAGVFLMAVGLAACGGSTPRCLQSHDQVVENNGGGQRIERVCDKYASEGGQGSG